MMIDVVSFNCGVLVHDDDVDGGKKFLAGSFDGVSCRYRAVFIRSVLL